MKEDIKVRFANRLRQLRDKCGYTQEKLSALSGVDYKHIQRLESKRPCAVKIDTLEKLAEAFGLSISKLLNF